MASRSVLAPTSFSPDDFTFDAAAFAAGFQGGQGLVVYARHKSGVQYAVKMINLTRFGVTEAVYKSAKDLALNEATIAASLHHAFIVPTLGHYIHNDRIFIIMKQLYGSVLVDESVVTDSDSVGDVLNVATMAAFALEELHANRIAHGDMKPDNLLRSASWYISLCDFGIARRVAVGAGDCDALGETRIPLSGH